MYFNFSHLSLQKQVLLLIILILLLVLISVLYTVKTSVSRTKPLSTEFIIINKAPKYKRTKLISKKIIQKLVQTVKSNYKKATSSHSGILGNFISLQASRNFLIYKKIVRFISIKNHNKKNEVQKK